jgi:hypothetical protein
MLSHDCYKCPFGITECKKCRQRYVNVRKGEFVYCPDGSRHLVDIEEDWIKK